MNLEQVHKTNKKNLDVVMKRRAPLSHSKFWIRAVASILVLLMVLQDLSYAAPAGTFVSEAVAVSAVSQKWMPRSKALAGIFAKLNLPEEMGKVDSTFWNSSKNTVIHIRDLHSNESAQRKIARIIDFLSVRYGVRMVQLEGASGELAHGLLSRYPDRKARVLMGRSYLNEGKITGPEYLAVTRNPGLILYGVEDKELYEKNRQALLHATELGEGLQPYLGQWRKVLERLAVRIFSPSMREWMTEREGFKNQQRTIAQYVRFLKRVCSREKLDCDTPQIKRLLKLEKVESRLRREQRFQKETEIEDYLGKILKKEGGLDLGIFEEIKKIEKTLEVHWVTPPAGLPWDLMSPAAQATAQLYKLFQILEIYEKMFELALTRGDVEFLYQNREEFEASSLSRVLTGLGHHYGYEINPRIFEFEQLAAALRSYEDFYDLALARDEKIVSASIESMRQYGETMAVLVSGGFHTPAIEERLKKEGYNFCTITPTLNEKMDLDKDRRLYLKAMSMAQSPMTQYAGVRDSALQLQIPSLFPTRAEMDSLDVRAALPQVMASHEHVGDLVTLMVALASTGLRTAATEELSAGLETAFTELSPGEQNLVSIYRSVNQSATRVRLMDAGTGSAVVGLSPDTGFGLEIHWKPAPFGSAAAENSLRQSFSFVTPDGVRSEVRVLTDPLLSDIAVRGFDRSVQKLRLAGAQTGSWSPGRPSAPAQTVRRVHAVPTRQRIEPQRALIPAPVKPVSPAKGLEVSQPKSLPLAAAPEKKAEVQPGVIQPAANPVNPLPEIAALFLLAAAGGPFASLPLAVIGVRLSWFSAIFIHGLGHVFFKWLTDKDHPFVVSEAMEGITPREFWKGLVPFLSIYTPGFSKKIAAPVPTGESTPAKVSLKALGGPLFNVLSASAAGLFLLSSSLSGPLAFGLYAVLTFNSLFAVLSWSDYASFLSGSAPYGLACGYLDYVGPRLGTDKKSLVPEEYIAGITNSTRILSGRGTQAYGFQTMALDRGGNVVFLGLKDVNPKRAVLHDRLRGDLIREVQSAKRDGFRPFDDLIDYSSHLRFGTSTPPAQKETHPHISPETVSRHYDWSDSASKIEARNKNFQIGVRHNGDNDGIRTEEQILQDHPVYAFGKELDYNDVRHELSRILYEDTTKGDSPVIASMLALYSAQGRWDAAARLAYLMMSGSLKESFPGLNSPEAIERITRRWGSVFDAEFVRHKDRLFTAQNGKWVPDRGYLEQTFIPAMRQAASTLKNDRYLGGFSAEVFEAFIQSAIFAFLHQDTYRAIQMLMATSLSSSTFGLSVSSTLDPRMKFWVARGQPGALGHNPDTGAFIAASDPGAVFGGLNNRSRFLTFNDDQGEVIRLDMKNARAPKLNIYSQALHRELEPQEIEARWSSVAGNPYTTLPPVPEEGRSALKQDIAELNSVLSRSHDGFDARHRANRKMPSNRITA
ncbi:MAG: hypothetical protein KBC91_04755, partial [Candidatus Omnitrophica bacterium]|nr:hypothetical protein [Candidatus Omnitrophota bacterium]